MSNKILFNGTQLRLINNGSDKFHYGFGGQIKDLTSRLFIRSENSAKKSISGMAKRSDARTFGHPFSGKICRPSV
jgi:hypothetical protein